MLAASALPGVSSAAAASSQMSRLTFPLRVPIGLRAIAPILVQRPIPDDAPSHTLASVRMAVVGHVEWVDFVEVERLPREGEVLGATAASARAAGGGGVAAAVLT